MKKPTTMHNQQWLIGILLLLAGCTPTQPKRTYTSSMYNDRISHITADYQVIHYRNETTLWVKVNSNDLLYTRADQASDFEAEVHISYKIFTSLHSKEMVDSATTRLIDVDADQRAKDLVGKIKLNLGTGDQFIIKVTARDVHRKTEQLKYIRVDRSRHARQHFMISMPKQRVPVFQTRFTPLQKVVIQNTQHRGKLYGRVYERNFPLPPPPFSTYGMHSFTYAADSTFTLEPNADGLFEFTLPKHGFVHLQSDSMTKKGTTLFVFDGGFPAFATHSTMIPPLRYLTSKQEFRDLELAGDKQAAFERFWLNRAGSKTRAKEVIKNYYGRVRNANINFTSYVEGWRTDRGLIHIIFGSPNTIYHNDNNEVWIYGQEHRANSLVFTFKKVKNPFTDNDYMLERSIHYKSSWYQALDSWRNGRTYTRF